MGLGNLGLTQPSVSSKVDEASEPDMLGKMLGGPNAIMDDTARAQLLESMLAQTEAAPTSSMLDQLMSPRGLLALLGTGAAGAIGGAPAAAGFGIGALGGAEAATQAELATKRKAIEELNKRYETALDQLDKSRQRVATLFNTNPEAFVDPVTGEQKVSPEVLGFYATGIKMPLFATTRRVMERRDEAWAKRNDLFTTALGKSHSPDEAKKILQGFFINMGYNAPDELTDTLAQSYGTQGWEQSTADSILKYGGSSGLDALIAAGENGWSLHDPRTLRMVEFKNPESSADKITPNDEFLRLANEINAWQADPANLEMVRATRAESATAEEFSRKIAQEVLGGREGDLRVYLHEAALKDPSEFNGIMANYKMLQDKYKLGIGISGIDKLPSVRNMTDEEQQQWIWGMAEDAYRAQQQQLRTSQANQDAAMANSTAVRLQKEAGLGVQQAHAVSKAILDDAMKAATRPDGRVDMARYQQEVKRLADEALAQFKGKAAQ